MGTYGIPATSMFSMHTYLGIIHLSNYPELLLMSTNTDFILCFPVQRLWWRKAAQANAGWRKTTKHPTMMREDATQVRWRRAPTWPQSWVNPKGGRCGWNWAQRLRTRSSEMWQCWVSMRAASATAGLQRRTQCRHTWGWWGRLRLLNEGRALFLYYKWSEAQICRIICPGR